ncbi:LysR family transcriptional regulator [Streptomyces venezuelae ATCC 10712]
MEMHQLRYFASVADEGSFTAAARRLLVSQSGVSTQVAKLERELGQRLIDRSGRRIRLTPAGQAVLPSPRTRSPRWRPSRTRPPSSPQRSAAGSASA